MARARQLFLNLRKPNHLFPVTTVVCLREGIWNLATPDIGFLPDIGSPDDMISGHMTRYRVFLLTRYRDMSDVTRYRVPISGTHPISGHHITDIVNHIPDIGINIGINIGCPDIGDMIFRYRCQYRVPISGVPISGYDSHRYRGQYRARYRVRVTQCAPWPQLALYS